MDPEWNANAPTILVVDDFYSDPDSVRDFALGQDYNSDLRYFKGLRSTERFLWPYLREEFRRLLGRPISAWTEYRANGVFQKTTAEDQLVYHADFQSYAGAIYLTPESDAGTSFWRQRSTGVRHTPVVDDPLEYTDEGPWERVEQVAGLYNRLVIWDGSLIHSASNYDAFDDADPRLVHLFFFDA